MKDFITINWHLTEICNFKCFFCFAKYNKNDKEIHYDKNNIDLFLNTVFSFFKKEYKNINLNLVGGEPLISKNINYIIRKAYEIGFNVSIISNGSLITKSFLESNSLFLKTIGISIDSLNKETNLKIGRLIKQEYKDILTLISLYNIDLKINTVVNKYNYKENFIKELEIFEIKKWKIFQAIKISSIYKDNDIYCSDEDFSFFLKNNNMYHLKDNKFFIESNNELKESYIMLDPFGRFFQNINNKYIYSSSILYEDIEKCFFDINFNYDKFIRRY